MKTFKDFISENKKNPGDIFHPGPAANERYVMKQIEKEKKQKLKKEEVMSAAPTNVVGGGNIAGSGGKGGEPGVSKKRNPVMSFFKRKQPKM